MRRALASMRFSAADRPRLASRSARSRTTWTTWTRSPDASFPRFALYRRDQLLSPPLSTFAPRSISELPERLPQETCLALRMTAIRHPVMHAVKADRGSWLIALAGGLRHAELVALRVGERDPAERALLTMVQDLRPAVDQASHRRLDIVGTDTHVQVQPVLT